MSLLTQKNTTPSKVRTSTFSAFLSTDFAKQKINEIIGSKNGQSFVTSIVSAVSQNPDLALCEHSTILSAALQGASLKLSPSPQLGHYYLVKYEDRNNKRFVAQFQLGYKALIQLAMRSGQYKDIDVMDIREGEYKGRDKFTGRPVIEFITDDEERENMPIVGYFFYFELLNGFRKSLYWSKEKMENHALQYSKGYASDKRKNTAYTFWSKDFNGMAFKTMIRQGLSKWGILSIDLEKAMVSDMAVIQDNQYNYIDNNDDLSSDVAVDYDAISLDGENTPNEEPKDIKQPAFINDKE